MTQPRPRSKRRKPYTREERLHRSVKRLLAAILTDQTTWFHPPNGMKTTKSQAGRHVGMGMRKGAADLIFCSRGGFYAIELKAPKGPNGERQGELRAVQKAWREELLRAGGKYEVARSIDDVIDILKSWKIPLKIKETTVGQAD